MNKDYRTLLRLVCVLVGTCLGTSPGLTALPFNDKPAVSDADKALLARVTPAMFVQGGALPAEIPWHGKMKPVPPPDCVRCRP